MSEKTILHYNAYLLSIRQSPHRSLLHHRCVRFYRPLQTNAGIRCYVPYGYDEHGLKIEQKAAEKGVTPKEYVDEIVKTFKGLWKFMNISYDRYIRTTDDYHIETVQKIFKELYDKGYIYKGEYKGKYCTPCESFWTESQLIDGKCPECGREVTEAKEEAYFFKYVIVCRQM